MNWIDHHRCNDVAAAWWVATGVGAAGIYDFRSGRAPKGTVKLGEGIALTVFIVDCIVTATLSTLTGVVELRNRNVIRRLLLLKMQCLRCLQTSQ